MYSHSFLSNRASLARLLTILLFCALTTSAYAIPVGTIQFVSGQVVLNDRAANLNAEFTAGSTIKTGTDGFAHVRFIDDAFISLRPGSILHIKAYHYNSSQPNENRVEFLLERGNLRSITGRAGETNKKGFRLNTPVAAIGIRGTDFVALTDDTNTRVRVVSGAIVVRSGSCSTSSYDCWNDTDQVLSANENHFLEVQQGQPPTLKNLLELPSDSPLLEDEPAPPAGTVLEKNTDTVTLEHNELDLANYTGQPQLTWGRWRGTHVILAPSTPLVSEQFTPELEMVARTDTFGLMRTASDTPMQHWPKTSSLDLKLVNSEVYMRQAGKLYSAQVDDSRLTLNFSTNEFNTRLSGTESLNNTHWSIDGKGSITANGLLLGDPDNRAAIKGALSKEGQQAAYIFSLPLDNLHSLEGATLWSR